MTTLFIQFAGDESGVTAIEYGLIAGLISIGIVSAVTVNRHDYFGQFLRAYRRCFELMARPRQLNAISR